jgi:uncharacterized membrane protein
VNFIKTTIIGGLLFLVPVVVLFMVVSEAGNPMLAVAEPLSHLVPIDSVAGVAMANIIAVLIVLIICFIAGLIARMGPARKFADKTESAILQKLPGYAMLKGFTSTLNDDQAAALHSVLVEFDDRSRLGLEVERIDGGRVAVYFPGSPNAWAGTVEIVKASQVQSIDAPMTVIIEHAELLGKGSAKLLSGSS